MTLLWHSASAQPQHPVFAGSWRRITRTCEPPAKKSGDYRIEFTERDSVLQVKINAAVKGRNRELLLSYKLGEPLHYTGLDGDDFRTTASWRGDSLVFDITELEDGKTILAQEVFSLNGDGAKLVSRKKEDGEREHSVCTSTYEKQRVNK